MLRCAWSWLAPIEFKSPTGLAQAWSNGEDRFLGARAQFLCRDVPLAIVECRRWTLVGRHWAPLPRLGTGHIGTGQRYQPTKTAHFNSRPACAYIHKDWFKTAQFEPSLDPYCLFRMSQFNMQFFFLNCSKHLWPPTPLILNFW